MDERLKRKLELLGEPALPEGLTAEALFRRIDSGELALPPEEEAPAQPGTEPAPKVIPWAKVLRRGVPIAACLALVVYLSQGGLWRMGSSGGSFTGNAAAPQAAAAADQAAPLEQYSLDAENNAGAPEEPDPGPRAIAIDNDNGVEEADEDTADAAPSDGAIARAENSDEKSVDTVADAEDPDNANPDSGPVVNPEIGIAGAEGSSRKEYFDYEPQVDEICAQLYLYDERLTGLTPVAYGYGVNPGETLLDIPCHFENDAGEEVAWRFILCSITPEGDGTYSLTLLDFIEWDGEHLAYNLMEAWNGESLPDSLLR